MQSVMMRFAVFIGLMVAGGAVLAQKKGKDEPKPIFSVNKKNISSDEFEYLYRKNHQGKKEEFTEQKIREYLDLFVNFKLKVTEATLRGMDTTKAFKKEFRSYRDELKKPYVASSDELDRLTKEAYQRMTQEIRASHLLINVAPEASPEDTLKAFEKIQSLRARAYAGESFDALARQFSEDPSAQTNGGDLGYFSALQMVYPFENAAFQLKPGEISQPVRTRFGYHLIKLVDVRSAQGEVEVSHILLRGTDDKVKNKAFDIYDQWKAGKPWNELCAEFSEDGATKNTGGKLRPFGTGALPSVPEFEATAFSLQEPGDVSDPFKTSIGWHLVRLEKKIPLGTYAELEPTLKRRVARDERLQISKTNQLNKRKKEVGYQESASAKTFLFSVADSSLQKGKWSLLATRPHTTDELFSMAGRAFTLKEFYSFVADNQRPSALPPSGYLQQLLDQFTEEQVNEMEDEKLQASNADYRNLLSEYREGILLFSIMEKEVWNKASEDTLGQRQFYEKSKEKYKAGERLHARLLATPEKSFLGEMKAKIEKGDTLTEADVKRFKIFTGHRAYEKGENKAVDKIAWAMGLHETEVDGMYYLVEVDRLLPAGIKSFDEARALVISDFQDEMEKKWVAQLRSRYPVKINKKVVKASIERLQKS